jgi:hypothetical protein
MREAEDPKGQMIEPAAPPAETEEQPAARSLRQRIASMRLRFPDPTLERAFREDSFHGNLGNVRFAFLAGIVLWIGWGILLRPYMLSRRDLDLDLQIRAFVFIPMLIAGYALSFTPIFRRIWEWFAVAIACATIAVWVFYA